MVSASISGSIDRNVYALLEKAFLDQESGKKPMLPIWLSPTQVRICPVSSDHLKDATKLAEELKKGSVRVDVDDRGLTVGKKIREAEQEWVPFIVVFGEKEKKGKLSVRSRDGKQEQLTVKELAAMMAKETEGKPFRPLPLPAMLSQRPIFFG